MNKGPTPTLPRWLMVLGSVAIVGHVSVLLVFACAGMTGPWVSRFGNSPSPPPMFVMKISEYTEPSYLYPLSFIHNGHFDSNKVDGPSVYFEIHLLDESGQRTNTYKFPDAKANPWVRARQHALAQSLARDTFYRPPQGEVIPPPGQARTRIVFFSREPMKADQKKASKDDPKAKVEENALELYWAEENQVPKEGVYRPDDWSRELAHAYGRHLQRKHGAKGFELVRHSREALTPMLMFPNPAVPAQLFVDSPMPEMNFEELVCSFGTSNQPKPFRAQ